MKRNEKNKQSVVGDNKSFKTFLKQARLLDLNELSMEFQSLAPKNEC